MCVGGGSTAWVLKRILYIDFHVKDYEMRVKFLSVFGFLWGGGALLPLSNLFREQVVN